MIAMFRQRLAGMSLVGSSLCYWLTLRQLLALFSSFGRYFDIQHCLKIRPGSSYSASGPQSCFVKFLCQWQCAWTIIMSKECCWYSYKKAMVLPEKYNIVEFKLYSLFDDFVDLLDEMHLGFLPFQVWKRENILWSKVLQKTRDIYPSLVPWMPLGKNKPLHKNIAAKIDEGKKRKKGRKY